MQPAAQLCEAPSTHNPTHSNCPRRPCLGSPYYIAIIRNLMESHSRRSPAAFNDLKITSSPKPSIYFY